MPFDPEYHDPITKSDLPVTRDESIGENVVSLEVGSFQVSRQDNRFQVRLWFLIEDELIYWETLLNPDQQFDLRTNASQRWLANEARKKFRDEIDDGSINAIADIRLSPSTKI